MVSRNSIHRCIQCLAALFLVLFAASVSADTEAELGVDALTTQPSVLLDAMRSKGRHMAKSEAAALEKSLAADPDNLPARAQLLGYYFYQGVKMEGAAATVKARRRHITWLIKNQPASPLAGMPEATIDPSGHVFADKIGYETASSMWRALVERDDVSPQTLENAYKFLRLNDKRHAEKIALKASDPYLIGEIYALGVSRVTLINQNGFVLGVGTSREDQQYAAHAVEVLRGTEDKRVLDSAAAVLLFNGALAQLLHQRKNKAIEPMPVAFAGELLERCGDCRSQSRYYQVMGMMSTSPAESKQYARAELALLEKEAAKQPKHTAGKNREGELLLLHELTKAAFLASETDKAGQYAQKMLSLIAEQKLEDRSGMEVHTGHIVLGRIALLRRDVKAAKKHLLAAADVKGGAALQSFGPNMALAKELLERGEREVVITYLTQCMRFWERGQDSLSSWIAAVERGEMPNFGPNLAY